MFHLRNSTNQYGKYIVDLKKVRNSFELSMKIYSVLKRSVGCSQINGSQNCMCMASLKTGAFEYYTKRTRLQSIRIPFHLSGLVWFVFSFFFFLALFLIKQTKHRYTHKYFITLIQRNERVHTNKLVCLSSTIRVDTDIDIAIDLYCIYSSVSNSFSHTNSNLKIMQMEEMQKLTQKKSKHTYKQTQALAYK